MRFAVLLTLALAAVPCAALEAQSSRDWITETTVTFGHRRYWYQSFASDAVAVADLGLRWSYPSGMGWGFSAVGGYEFVNEASLVGGRARVFHEWDLRRLEVSAALLVSSLGARGLRGEDLGGVFGVAFYPRPWGALVLQLDLVPRRPEETGTYPFDEDGQPLGALHERVPEASLGFRVAERAGVITWISAGLLALVAIAAEAALSDAYF